MSVSCIFVADGAKTWLQGEDLLEVEPLGLPGAGHGLAGGVLCVGYSSGRILRNSLMG